MSIHFQGKLDQQNKLPELIKELADIAISMEWPYQKMSFDNNVKGIVLTLHKKCDTLILLFDESGTLISPDVDKMEQDPSLTMDNQYIFVKTQFAPVEVHITLVKLLKYIKYKYINNLKVIDEGEYWDKEDLNLLIDKRNIINNGLNSITEKLKNHDLSSLTQDEIVAFLMTRLKDSGKSRSGD